MNVNTYHHSPILDRKGLTESPVFSSLRKKLKLKEGQQLESDEVEAPGIDGNNGSNVQALLYKNVLFIANANPKKVTMTEVDEAYSTLNFLWKDNPFDARSQLLKIAHRIDLVESTWDLLMTEMQRSDSPDEMMTHHMGRKVVFLTQLLNPNDVYSEDDRTTQKMIVLSLLHYMHSGITATATVAPVQVPTSMDGIYGLSCLMLFQFFHQKYNIGKEDGLEVMACLRFYVADKMSISAKKELRNNLVLFNSMHTLMNKTLASREQDEDTNLTEEARLFEDTVGELYSAIFHFVPLVRVE